MKSMLVIIVVFLFMTLLFITSCQNQNVQSAKSQVSMRSFGTMDSGQEVLLYKLTNASGMSVEISGYGAALVSITTADKQGTFADVLLGYDTLDGYRNDASYLGGIVGRYGNRIAKGRFTLDGVGYQLATNDGENHLHGGVKGFNKQVWQSESIDHDPGPSVRFRYTSADGEEGYPGEVALSVMYTLTDDNELRIEYSGSTDKPTILNPTSHGYFNLTGNPQNTILKHELMIDAEMYTPVDQGLIPLGELAPVSETPMDFRNPTPIGARIDAPFEQLKFGKGYDHNWVLNHYDGSVQKVASLHDPASGRLMEILTDQPGLQFYSGNFLDGSITGKSGIKYNHRTGLCLEAQFFPDSPNQEKYPSVVLYPGEEYHQTTVYRFSVQ